MGCGLSRVAVRDRVRRSAARKGRGLPAVEARAILSGENMCIYTSKHFFQQEAFLPYCAFNRAATSSKSRMIPDHRSLPRIPTTLSWAERQAGSSLTKAARPFAVI